MLVNSSISRDYYTTPRHTYMDVREGKQKQSKDVLQRLWNMSFQSTWLVNETQGATEANLSSNRTKYFKLNINKVKNSNSQKAEQLVIYQHGQGVDINFTESESIVLPLLLNCSVMPPVKRALGR